MNTTRSMSTISPLRICPLLASTLFLLAVCTAPRAEVLMGQVLDAQGSPAAGVNIDFINKRGGGPPITSNDGTDAGGFFTTNVTPGVFDVLFIPPPGSTKLPATVENVGAVGTVDLGVITLPEGALIQGRVLSHQGLPLASVTYELLAEADDALLAEGLTDVFGQFTATVPFGPAELRLDPELALGVMQAPRLLVLPLNASENLGDVQLEQGFQLSATLLLPSGFPAVNVDSDTRDSATGEVIWTPSDNSNLAGTLSIVLPAGVYDFVVCPKATTGLLAQEFADVNITHDVFGGVHQLIPGVPLSGTVTDSLGQPLKNIDVDLVIPGTGKEVPLCGDNTNAAGQYSIIGPPGIYDLRFTPPHDQLFGSAFEAAVTLATPVVLNSTLPDCPLPSPYGSAFPGAGGLMPDLSTGGGSSRLGNDDFTLLISNARGAAEAFLLFGTSAASIPFHGATQLVDSPAPPGSGVPGLLVQSFQKSTTGGQAIAPPLLLRALRLRGTAGVPGAGQLMVSLPIPDDPSWAGVSRYAQVLVRDPAAMDGWSLTHGIQITFCE